MGKLISIAGNLGAGKTTLTKLICDKGSFSPYWEIPEERPFHIAYGKDPPRWALANQMDFFLFRCEQETNSRQRDEIAVFDGGFDQDFHVYTQHIFARGYLNQEEFNICQRYYHLVRELLPPPDFFIRIMVDIPTLLQRRSLRGRKTDDHLFDLQELTEFERLIDQWFEHDMPAPVVQFSFEKDLNCFTDEIDSLVVKISDTISPAGHPDA
jgi:deoxyadenosine/deoxycytidine kinase